MNEADRLGRTTNDANTCKYNQRFVSYLLEIEVGVNDLDRLKKDRYDCNK